MNLSKGKGSKRIIKSFQEITLADLNGKDFGVVLRTALFTAITVLGGDAQCGPVSMAALHISATCN